MNTNSAFARLTPEDQAIWIEHFCRDVRNGGDVVALRVYKDDAKQAPRALLDSFEVRQNIHIVHTSFCLTPFHAVAVY